MDNVEVLCELERTSIPFINISNTKMTIRQFKIQNQIMPDSMPLFFLRFSDTTIDNMFIM